MTRTVLFDHTAASSSMNRVDDTSDAVARSPARAPFTVTSSSEVAPGARLGRSQETSAANFLVSFPETDIKTRKRLSWILDAECSAIMRDYLCIARPLFPGAAATDALWMGNHGAALDVVGLTGIATRRTREWFGIACGPHSARKWLQSSAARRSPQAAFDAAEVAGHSIRVALNHYRQADGVGAAQRHAANLRDMRRRTAGIAARAFAAMEAGTAGESSP